MGWKITIMKAYHKS